LDDTITAYLGRLAERTAAPAGGATAAMNAAQAAALLAMTARYCDGPMHAGHAEAIGKIIAEADQLRHTCVALMAADGESYTTVIAAYHLPKDTEELRVTRAAAIGIQASVWVTATSGHRQNSSTAPSFADRKWNIRNRRVSSQETAK